MTAQQRFRINRNSIISYPNPHGAWKWMICLRLGYPWTYPRYLYRTLHSEHARTWVFGVKYCCVSVHYQMRWRDYAKP